MFKELLADPGVLVQGITGRHGSFHAAAMIEAGTRVVAGVTPGKAGMEMHGVPVFDSVAEARAATGASVSVVFVPAPHAKAALLEAVEAGVKVIICITEGIPVQDMLVVLRRARAAGAVLVGPNCPGILIPRKIKLGIIPASVGAPGDLAVVSRSGTLTYEAAAALSAAGAGQRYIVGIGGDRLRGVSFKDCLAEFEADPAVKRVVLIGEIGGTDEQHAAEYIKEYMSKPVFAYVVGHTAKPDTQLGHAGAILSGKGESAAEKTAALIAAGAKTSMSLPQLVAEAASWKKISPEEL